MSFVRESSIDSNWHCTNIRKGEKTVVVVIWLVVEIVGRVDKVLMGKLLKKCMNKTS